MRVFISADMEGCTGIVHGDQLGPSGFDYRRGRELMTGDLVAAAEAALAYESVSGVRICDGHGTMRNVLLERLPSGCELVTGPASSRTLCQSEGFDGDFGAMILVGHHARAGTRNAVLPHTWVGSIVREVRVNGRVFGEIALNAAIAGAHGVAVACVTSDVAGCAEAREFLGGDLQTVAVKRAVGPKSAICKTPAETDREIRLGVLQGLQDLDDRKPFVVAGEVEIAVQLHRTEMADRAGKRPGSERTGSHEVTFSRATYMDAVREAWALIEWTAGDHPEWLR